MNVGSVLMYTESIHAVVDGQTASPLLVTVQVMGVGSPE